MLPRGRACPLARCRISRARTPILSATSMERRHQHAMRHTFITLVQDDGADGSIIRWITHAPPRTAFDGYMRALLQRP